MSYCWGLVHGYFDKAAGTRRVDAVEDVRSARVSSDSASTGSSIESPVAFLEPLWLMLSAPELLGVSCVRADAFALNDWTSGWHESVLRRRRAASSVDIPTAAWPRSVPMVGGCDGVCHFLDVDAFGQQCAASSDRFRALCGRVVLGTSLMTPAGPPCCDACRVEARRRESANQALAARTKRRIRKSKRRARLNWLLGGTGAGHDRAAGEQRWTGVLRERADPVL